MKRYVEAKLGKKIESAEKLRKFLRNDRKVLRFEGEWDDTASVYGDRNAYILQYFLGNDTVDVREVSVNCKLSRVLYSSHAERVCFVRFAMPARTGKVVDLCLHVKWVVSALVVHTGQQR